MIGPVQKLQFLKLLIGDSRLSAADLRCGVLIIDLYNEKKGYAWPPMAHLEERSNCSHATIARSIKRLDKLGWIKKARGGKGRANRYNPAFHLLAPPGVDQGGASGAIQTEQRNLADNISPARPAHVPTGATRLLSPARQYTTTTLLSTRSRVVVVVAAILTAPPAGPLRLAARGPPVVLSCLMQHRDSMSFGRSSQKRLIGQSLCSCSRKLRLAVWRRLLTLSLALKGTRSLWRMSPRLRYVASPINWLRDNGGLK